MMESEILDSVSMPAHPKKLFTEKQIGVSAFMGGPVPAGILIYMNLKRLDRESAAYAALASTFIFTVGLAYVLISIPDHVFNKVPSNLFSTLIGVVVWVLYRVLISRVAKEEFEAGSKRESNWKVAGLTLVGITLYLVISLSLASVTPYFTGDKLTFDGNEVYFERTQASKEDVQVLADRLFEVGYFEKGQNFIAKLEVVGDTYTVILPLQKHAWEDPGVVDGIRGLKDLLQMDYGAAVSIVIEDYDLTGNRLTKTF